ncbi:hypothetical protein BC830DRAFT_943255 [Chytriomyces sp. MP71]|nr:hypothetical protein BC830DRAFT_943255 [Chytriomyces sp. MP71]
MPHISRKLLMVVSNLSLYPALAMSSSPRRNSLFGNVRYRPHRVLYDVRDLMSRHANSEFLVIFTKDAGEWNGTCDWNQECPVCELLKPTA